MRTLPAWLFGLFLTCMVLACMFLAACGGTSAPPVPEDPAARRELDAFFLAFRQRIQEGSADSLPRYLTRESLDWIDDIRRASRTEPTEYLKERPFHEILCILALRVERRTNPGFDDRPAAMLDKLLIGNQPVRKTLIKTEIAESRVRGDRGEIGLRQAPNVPVFQFGREKAQWKFHFHKSLPLILQGAESLARQRKPTHLEQAIWILDQYGRPVLAEDLKR